MKYKNPTNPGSILSSSNIAKETKELLNKKEEQEEALSKVECGIDNPCVFGKHNKNFNKDNINKI